MAPAPTTREVLADWNDAEAAVLAAAAACEMAVLSQTQPAPNRLLFTLTTIRDEPATLLFTLLEAPRPGSDGPSRISLTSHVGRTRDTAREAALIDAAARRLGQLAGREFAPRR